MREDEDLRALLQSPTQGRHRGPDAGVAAHGPVLHRNIEVFADEDAFLAQVQVRQTQDLHDTFDQATVVSIIRLEKPHSLSYQAHAFTRLPSITLVRVASKIEECGL